VFVDDLDLKYGTNRSLAGIADINFVPLKTSNSKSEAPFLYPQALAKQYILNKKPKYKTFDFTLLVNNCKSMPESRNNEYGTIMIHEILHGLGLTSLASVKELYNNKNTDNDKKNQFLLFNKSNQYFFSPREIYSYSKNIMEATNENEYLKLSNNTKITGFKPFSVFDKHLVSIKSGERIFKDLQFYYKEANKNCLPENGSPLLKKDITNEYLSGCFKKFNSKTQNIVIRTTREYYFDYHTLGIKTIDGSIVPLQTFNGEYKYGSSVCHLTNPLYDEYLKRVKKFGENSASVKELKTSSGSFKKEAILKYYDDNYVMYVSDEDNFTIKEMLKILPNNQKHPLIGNGIIKIMATLGWTVKGTKRNSKIHYIDDTLHLPEANSIHCMNKEYELSKKK